MQSETGVAGSSTGLSDLLCEGGRSGEKAGVVGVTTNFSLGPRVTRRYLVIIGVLPVDEKYPHDSRVSCNMGVPLGVFLRNHFIHTKMPIPARQQTPATVPAVTTPVGSTPLRLCSSSSSGVDDSVDVAEAEALGGVPGMTSGASDVSTGRYSGGEVDDGSAVDVELAVDEGSGIRNA